MLRGVEGAFELFHEGEAGFADGFWQEGFFGETDAMFAGEGAAEVDGELLFDEFVAEAMNFGEDVVFVYGSGFRWIFADDAGLSFCEAGVGHSASNVLFLAGAHSSADFLRVEPAFGGLFFADAMDFGEDAVFVHRSGFRRLFTEDARFRFLFVNE